MLPRVTYQLHLATLYSVFQIVKGTPSKSRKEKSSETDSIKFKISSKTPRGKKGQHKKTSP